AKRLFACGNSLPALAGKAKEVLISVSCLFYGKKAKKRKINQQLTILRFEPVLQHAVVVLLNEGFEFVL
ncbi:MAG: hypothetical protein ACO1OQ_11270, partial [Rufibacter sp.]